MIGNKKGWLIAAFIAAAALLMVLVVVMRIAFGVTSGATAATLAEGKLDLWTIGQPIASVVDTPPTGGGDAGGDYATAIRVYGENEQQIRDLQRDLREWRRDARRLMSRLAHEPQEVQDREVQALQVTFPPVVAEILGAMAKGARQEDMAYVSVRAGYELTVSRSIEASQGFTALAQLVIAIAEYRIYRGEHAQAVEPLQNMCVMGWHMFNERAHTEMMYKGLIIQADAVRMLQYAYSGLAEEDKFARAGDYLLAIEQIIERFETKRDVIMPAPEEHLTVNPGDVFNIVNNDADRAWRVQGILALGVLKFQALDRNDHRMVRKLIRENLTSDEPLIRAAAMAARDLAVPDDREPADSEDTD